MTVGRAGLAAVALVASGLSSHGALSAPAPAPARGPRVTLTVPGGPAPEFTLPVPETVVTERALRAPHHDYPASDLMVPTGTPVFAVAAGRVGTHEGAKCGLGVSLVGPGGYRFVYCHLSVITVADGQAVRAADVIGLSGDTGNASGVPHLHFHVLAGGRNYVCPQDLLVSWFHHRAAPPAAWHRTTGCFFARGP